MSNAMEKDHRISRSRAVRFSRTHALLGVTGQTMVQTVQGGLYPLRHPRSSDAAQSPFLNFRLNAAIQGVRRDAQA